MKSKNIKQFDLSLKSKLKKTEIVAYDECGRGSMAGIFVAASVIVPDDYFNDKINDSKQISEPLRFELAEEIKRNCIWNIVDYSPAQIDMYGVQKINIQSFLDLRDKVEISDAIHIIDGTIMDSEPWCISIPKGDATSFGIACASIVAKAYRDQIMIDLSKDYPNHRLDKNKGYGLDYINAINEFGIPKDIHRHSFKLKKKEANGFF